MGGFNGGHSSGSHGGFSGGGGHSHGSGSSYGGSYGHYGYIRYYKGGHYYYSGSTLLIMGIISIVLSVVLFLAVLAASNTLLPATILIPFPFAFFGIFMTIVEINSAREDKKTVDWNGDGKIDEKDVRYKKDLNLFTIGYYQSKKNKVITLILRIIGYILFVVGLIFSIFLFEVRCSATVTYTTTTRDENHIEYEIYWFDYEFGGKKYEGRGDDDLSRDINGNIAYSVKEGETYYVYVYLNNPRDYHFQPTNVGIIFSIIFFTAGAGFLLVGILFRRKKILSFKYIGDLNNDGVVDEEDLKLYNQQIFINLFEAEETKELTCKYCGNKLDLESLYCPKCGGRVEFDKNKEY